MKEQLNETQLASGLEANGSSYGSNSDDERCVRVDTNKQVAAKALDSMNAGPSLPLLTQTRTLAPGKNMGGARVDLG